ncbi:WD40-repeat-containing domain protein [Polychytrium aggregatum]|uniref:WD40-repeat-containing domain protein n=1 Tax=Polychytrium aggregatum TaxID=110093 RepID=UPI0022FEA026|nr:WD40-repeat-containing domain protein [Polychytrium aggregatum]KAI9206666.1 WD40-repeat-containing domain protein [Polychytrium aggregatum]
MALWEDIAIPSVETVTFGELQGKLVQASGPNDASLEDYARRDGMFYPHIIVPYTYQRHEKGAIPPIRNRKVLARNLESDDSDNSDLERAGAHSLAQIGSNIYLYLDSFILPTIRSLIGETLGYYQGLSDSLNQSPVRALAWHPYKQLFAIAHRENSIHLFDLTNGVWIPESNTGLTHEAQYEVTCMEWNPHSGMLLAVAVRGGVLLWKIGNCHSADDESAEPSRASKRKSHTCEFLSAPGLEYVSTLTWSSDGRYLVAGSGAKDLIVIWDTLGLERDFDGKPVPIYLRKFRGQCTKVLKWSPDGNYLLQICGSSILRIWETHTWECVNINLTSPAQSAAWMPDSKTIIFALQGSHSIFNIKLNRDPPSLDIRDLKPQRLPRRSAPILPGREMVTVGGPIKSLAVDPKGRRLIVIFDHEELGSELLALLSIEEKPLPQFTPIGLIRGPHWQPGTLQPQADAGLSNRVLPEAVSVQFAAQFTSGALASIVWKNGKIGFLPCSF